jgi:hypothetical protein
MKPLFAVVKDRLRTSQPSYLDVVGPFPEIPTRARLLRFEGLQQKKRSGLEMIEDP